MSTAASTSMDIFRAVIEHGPLTLYSANTKTRMPIGTIHRHFKQLEKLGKIRVYDSDNKGRKKIGYGPTIYGMVSFYKQDREFNEKIENYYLLWIENKEFRKELESEGFDVSINNLKKSKHIFRIYMDYFSAVEEQIEKIKNGDDVISRNLQIFFSSIILSSNPQYEKLWRELYVELPGMQKSLEDHMDTMIKSYREFKKSLKK